MIGAERFTDLLATTLAHSLWQGAAIAGLLLCAGCSDNRAVTVDSGLDAATDAPRADPPPDPPPHPAATTATAIRASMIVLLFQLLLRIVSTPQLGFL